MPTLVADYIIPPHPYEPVIRLIAVVVGLMILWLLIETAVRHGVLAALRKHHRETRGERQRQALQQRPGGQFQVYDDTQ